MHDGEDASDKQAIHVTREIHLEEYARESKHGMRLGDPRRGGNIDEEAMEKDRKAWSDETPQMRTQYTNQYSVK
jgi:hypothetical protein